MSYYGLPPDAETSILPEDLTGALGYVPVNRAGDTFQGPVLLSRDPAEDMEAATKRYVDSKGLGIGAGSITVTTFSGDGSNTTFTLPTSAPGPSAVEVHIDSAYQLKSSYTIDGTSLTFGEAPPAGTDNIEVQIRTVLPLGSGNAATTIYTPSDGTANTTVEYVLDSRLTRLVRKFSGNGSTTTFSLPVPAFGNAVDVHIDSLYQLKSSYTVVDNLLTFSEAPPSGTDNIEVILDAIAPLGSTDASLISYTPIDGSSVASVKDALDQRNTVSVYKYTGDGSASTFLLPFAVPNANMVQVHINSVYQEKSTYTLSGTSLTLNSTPSIGASIEVTVNYALPIGTSDAATTQYLSDDGLIVSNVKDALDTFKKERGTATVARYSGTGSATTFVLPTAVSTSNSLDVYIDGAYQQKDSYTAYGTVLTFGEAPLNNTLIEVVIRKELPLSTMDSMGVNYTPAGSSTQTTVKEELDRRATQYAATFVGDGTTTSYTLPVSVSGNSVVSVHFDGVYQQKASYTATGTTLTFDQAPISGVVIEVTIKYEIPFSSGDAATTIYNPNDGTTPTNVKAVLDQIRADRNTVNLDDFTGDGTKTVFTLAKAPVGVMVTDVYINASYQQKATYSIVGRTLTFSEAPPSGSAIEVLSRSTAAVGVTDASLVTNGTETVADSLNALQLADYTALRNYVGPRTSVYVSNIGISGSFTRDDSDITSVDDGGTIIVSTNGKRWKRQYNGIANVNYFYVSTDTDSTAMFNRAIAASRKIYVPAGTYLISSVSLKSNTEIFGDGDTTLIQMPNTANYGFICDSGSSNISNNITNITLKNFQLRATTDVDGFSEFKHLVAINGVSNVLIENVLFKGFRGDGLYIGSGFSGTDERHNQNVYVKRCRFDGITRENRNAISLIDINGITIEACDFSNCSKSTMPGPIDFEPDSNTFHVIQNVRIRDNTFNNNGGSSGEISFYQPAAVTAKPTNITIENNSSTGYVGTGAFFFYDFNVSSSTTDLDNDVIVSGNKVKSSTGRPFNIYCGKRIDLSDNTWTDVGYGASVGYMKTVNVTIFNDRFIRCGSTEGNGMSIYSVDDFNILRGAFVDCGTGSAGASNAVDFNTGTSNKVTFDGVDFTSPSGKTLVAIQKESAHTLTPSTNKFYRCNLNNLTSAFQSEESDSTETSYNPVVTGSSTNGTGTYTLQYGRYRRVGKTVFFKIRLDVSAGHTGTGMIQVSLPTTVTSSTNNAETMVDLMVSGSSTTGGHFGLINPALVVNSLGAIRGYYTNTGTSSQLIIPTGAFTVYASGSYQMP